MSLNMFVLQALDYFRKKKLIVQLVLQAFNPQPVLFVSNYFKFEWSLV